MAYGTGFFGQVMDRAIAARSGGLTPAPAATWGQMVMKTPAPYGGWIHPQPAPVPMPRRIARRRFDVEGPTPRLRPSAMLNDSTDPEGIEMTTAPEPPNGGGILDKLFSGFGDILGKTASQYADIKSKQFITQQQKNAGIVPPRPVFSLTNPGGGLNMGTIATLGAVALGAYFLMRKR